MPNYESEKQHLKNSAILPLVFIVIIWFIKIAETLTRSKLGGLLGVYPRSLDGLKGIFSYPLVHGNWEHLLSNTMPLFILGFLFMNSYRIVAARVLPLIYIGSGLGIWLIGRQSNHIGASGLVYGLAFFLFFSGIWRKDRNAMALSAFVAIFYGGMTWGLYPMDEQVSWEGHLAGAIVGTLCAYQYRHINPAPRYDWELQPEPEEQEIIVEHPFWVPIPMPPDEELPNDLEDNEPNDETDKPKNPQADKEINNNSPKPIADTKKTNDALNWEIKYHFVPHQPNNNPPESL